MHAIDQTAPGSPVQAHRLSALAAGLKQALSSVPVAIAFVVLCIVALVAIFAPWLGTDAFGRDTWSRVLYGARVSLLVGLGASMASVALGLFIGVIAGFFRSVDLQPRLSAALRADPAQPARLD